MTPAEALRAALEHDDEAAIRAAMKACSGEEVYAALRWHTRPLHFIWEALLEAPAKADPRWLDSIDAPADTALDGRHEGTLAFLYACARDPDDPTAKRAFSKLFNMLHNASGLSLRGAACLHLGVLRNPRATPELVEEMTRPSTSAAMSAYCIAALERCGDGTALPTLRAVRDTTNDDLARAAVLAIEARVGRLDFEQIRRVRADPDPAVADLARRAQLGDEDAYLVLEDALRERAR